MITKEKVLSEIEQLKTSPMTGDNCSSLAALLIINEHLFKDGQHTAHSIATNEPQHVYNDKPIKVYSEHSNPFLRAIDGKETESLIPIFDELLSSVKVLYPKMYEKTIKQILEI